MRTARAAALAIALLAAAGAPATELGTIRFDNWLYFQKNTNDSERWQYRPRFYIPFNLGGGWTFTQRFDLPVYYTDTVGPDNPTGKWQAGIADWFVEEIVVTPELAQNLKLSASVRFVFPTGGQSPFSSSQYQWAPSVGAIYTIPERGITINPLARYFVGFAATEPGVSLVRKLDLFPGVRFDWPDGWAISFYDENAITYNVATHQWFVPIDVLFIKRLTKTVELSFGGAYGIVKDDPQYQYVIDGRLRLYF